MSTCFSSHQFIEFLRCWAFRNYGNTKGLRSAAAAATRVSTTDSLYGGPQSFPSVTILVKTASSGRLQTSRGGYRRQAKCGSRKIAETPSQCGSAMCGRASSNRSLIWRKESPHENTTRSNRNSSLVPPCSQCCNIEKPGNEATGAPLVIYNVPLYLKQCTHSF